MKAEIKDLGKKYYGTEVEILSEGGISQGLLSIWVMGDYQPSEREVKLARESLEMPTEPEKEVLEDWLGDSHYETKLSYALAKYLADGVNEGRINASS